MYPNRRLRPWSDGAALFVILGLSWIVLGAAAIIALWYATPAAIIFVGVLLIVGGVLHCVHAFMTRDREGFVLQLLEGLLNLVVGAFLLADPTGGAIALTLLIGIFLVIGGALRCALAFMVRRTPVWGWLVASGAVEVVLGLIVLVGWPRSAAWVIGLFIGIRMVFSGMSMLALGLSPRGTASPV
jgi:uncharacterized membrane protein HdeD (DUF308 family)